ncbi:hypothetical protein LTR56_010754 [Elasticomyces elasticus]|nr:hypothetical protein LTR56_010754 [Elasticomyces elasticus]KAK3667779.1 hypothetical protein LTR22_001224 [Elasticomyces elasticus]KAK4932228.1 hypothetical protein LTR49_001525 [Elasticomyces elasticus]KAK5763392.1 hypothetical protein LTS12_006363 [Elasticomyces elasticus]
MKMTNFEEHVRVLVGPEAKGFTVHKDLICRRSPFFEAAASARWTRGLNKNIELSDDDPEAFAAYLAYLYRAELPMLDEEQGTKHLWHNLADLYILADKLRDLKTANDVIDEILEYSDLLDKAPTLTIIRKVYDVTSDSCPLRRLLVDYRIHKSYTQHSDEFLQTLPKAFYVQFFSEYAKMQRGEDSESSAPHLDYMVLGKHRPRCHYHQHDDAYPAEKCESMRR